METKICGTCKLELSIDNFAIRKLKTKTILQWQCKSCQKEYRKTHYQENKQKYIIKAREYNKSVANWFDDYKKELKCSKCNESRWWVLDFHHLNPLEKEFSIASLKGKASKPKLLKEVEKCIVLCSNCHRDFHYQEKLQDVT